MFYRLENEAPIRLVVPRAEPARIASETPARGAARVFATRPAGRPARRARRRVRRDADGDRVGALRPGFPSAGLVVRRCANVDRFESVSLEFAPEHVDEAALEDLVRFMLGESDAFLRRAPLAGLGGDASAAPHPQTIGAAATSGSRSAITRPRAARRPRSAAGCAGARAAASSRVASSADGGGAEQPLVQEPRQLRQRRDDVRRLGEQPPLQRRQPIWSSIQRSRNGFAVTHRSRSGSSCRPRPSTLSSVFCSSTSCGWISTLNRRDARKSCSSTLAERDLRQRPVEDRLADDADLGLELVDARVRRHPARLDVRGRDAVVVAAEEREEVLREVALVASRTACP